MPFAVVTTCPDQLEDFAMLFVPTADRVHFAMNVERDRRAAMALFAYEVERGRRLMAAQTRLALGKVDDAVAAVADLRAGRGDIQREELPAVGFRELLTRMLHHGFERNQLQDGTDGVVRVRDAIP